MRETALTSPLGDSRELGRGEGDLEPVCLWSPHIY